MEKNKGVGLTGFVITILVILLAVAIAGCVYLLKNPVKEKVAVQNPAPVTELNSSNEVKETEMIMNENIYSKIKGLYEYEVTETNLGEDNDNYLFRLQLFEDGTFRYEYIPGKRSSIWFYR